MFEKGEENMEALDRVDEGDTEKGCGVVPKVGTLLDRSTSLLLFPGDVEILNAWFLLGEYCNRLVSSPVFSLICQDASSMEDGTVVVAPPLGWSGRTTPNMESMALLFSLDIIKTGRVTHLAINCIAMYSQSLHVKN